MRMTLYGFLNYDTTLFDDVTLPEGLEKTYCIDEIIRRSGDLFPYHQQPVFLKRNITNWFGRNYGQFERMIDALLAEYNPIENYDRKEDFESTPGVKRTETHSGTDTDSHSGTDTTTHSGSDTNAHSGKDTNKHTGTDTDSHSGIDIRAIESKPGSTMTTTNTISAFNSSGFSNHDKSESTGSGTDKSLDNFTHGESVATQFNSSNEMNYLSSLTTIYDSSDKVEYESSVSTTHGHKITSDVEGKDKTFLHAHGNIGVTTNATMVNEELELRRFDIYSDIARRFEKEFLIQVY